MTTLNDLYFNDLQPHRVNPIDPHHISKKYVDAQMGGCDLSSTINEENVCQGYDGPCDNEGIIRRRNTAYVEDHLNYVTMCDECFKSEQDHWREMWDDYYCARF